MKGKWIIGLTILVGSLICGVDVAQRRSSPVTGATRVSDDLVFADREWIYYLAPNSPTPRRLTKGNFPALSPDRRRVAYCEEINTALSARASGALMLFDLARGTTKTLFRGNAWCAHSRWSPDGNRISVTLAFSSGKSELHLIAPDGASNQTVVTGGEQGIDSIFNPTWTADGSLYFQDMNNLVLVNTAGQILAKTPLATIVGEKEAVTSSDLFVSSPSDSSVLAYTSSVPGTPLFEKTFGEPNTALFIYDQRAKTRKRLTPIDILALDPVWSRDGNFIYFTGYRDREGRGKYPFKIYRIARDGTGLAQVAAGETPDT